MNADEIRAAIAASNELQALLPDTEAIAAALSGGRKQVRSRITSARGIAGLYPAGPLAAEAVLLKLEATRDAMLASTDSNTKVFGSLLRRQLGFLSTEGLDFGDGALRTMLDQLAAQGVLTAPEAGALKSIAEVPAEISEFEVRCAIYADDGTLRV